MGRRIFITAAEVSGDLHASHLARALRAADPGVVLEGHGGTRMREAGVEIHTETTAKAAMGFSALGRVREMYRLLKWTREHFRNSPPDLQICVDSPAVNFHFAKIAHERGVPVLYYVAPQLWAWREGRMKKVRTWVDKLACILPFEEGYFRGHGVDATFVGHPLFDELSVGAAAAGREAGSAPVVGLLAGSRRSEAVGNFARMLLVAGRIQAAFGGVRFLCPATAATEPVIEAQLRASSTPRALAEAIEVRRDAFDEMVPRCDLAITVSGTATLHVAIHKVPMVIVYHASPLAWNLIGRWLIKTRTYTLVNLLAADPQLASGGRVTPEMHIVPEFIPWYGDIGPAAERAIELLKNSGQREAQRAALGKMTRSLGGPGASARTAALALGMLK